MDPSKVHYTNIAYPDTGYQSTNIQPQPLPPGATNFSYIPEHRPDSVPLKAQYSPHVSEIHQAPKPKSLWRWRLRNVASNLWVWEIAACLISVGIAALIAWQLKKLDGQSTYVWDYRWSPTSSLALAITIAKAAMLVPVASALGQLKWHWFKTPRKLDGLEHFDEASRGVLGSLRLLWRLRCWHIASIGAFITVCALSIDALTQNAVRIASLPDHTYGSFVYRVRAFDSVSSLRQRGRDLPSSDMLTAAYYAMAATAAPTFDQSLAECVSGNCTFGVYNSLAIDSQCVPSKTVRSGSIVHHAGVNENDFFLNVTNTIVKSNTTIELPASGVYKNLGPLISRWLVLTNPTVVNPAPSAFECAFYWSVKTYSSEVKNGVFEERVHSTYVNSSNIATHSGEDIYITPDRCWRNNVSIPTSNPNCTGHVTSGSHASLQSWFGLSDFSLAGSGFNDTKRGDKMVYWDFSSIFIQSLITEFVNQNETHMFNVVNITASRLSTTLTTMLRQMPEIYSENGDPTEDIYGKSNGTTIWTPHVIYNIQWHYLIFPMILLGSSVLFFVATCIFTWGEGGWKSSQLAVVFHGLSEQDNRAVGSVKRYADMREVGRGMHVQLMDSATGKKLTSKETLMQM